MKMKDDMQCSLFFFVYVPHKEKTISDRGSVDNREGKLIASHMDGSNPKTVGTFSSGDMLESAVILK